MKKKSISLKWELLAIVLICWVLPVLMFAFGMVTVTNLNAVQQGVMSMTYSFDSAVRSAQNNLRDAVAASRSASYDSTIRLAWLRYAKDENEVALYDSVQSFMSNHYRYDSNIMDAVVFFMDEPDRLYAIANEQYGGIATQLSYYRENIHAKMLGFSRELDTGFGFFTYEDNLYLLRNMMDSSYQPYGMIVLHLDQTNIFSNVRQMAWESGSAVYIDGLEVVITDNGAAIPHDATLSSDVFWRRTDNLFTMGTERKLESHRMTYVSNLENYPLSPQMTTLYTIVILAVALTIALTLIFIFYFYRNINRPVSSLVKASEKISGGELGYHLEGNFRGREFNTLANSFNDMSSQLEAMFERSTQEQIALQDARIDALQSQLNPHFLNNTLEIINWEARMYGAHKVSEMIEALSTMLTGAMARDGEAMICVSEELAYLNSYLYIIGARLGKRLTVNKEVDESLLSLKVPRMVMQPLVENAVEHGIIPRQRGEIVLRIYAKDKDLILEVENDGALSRKAKTDIKKMLLEDGTEQQHSAKLGVRNVHQRIKLIYGEDSGLEIISLPDGKTLARITIKNVVGAKQ